MDNKKDYQDCASCQSDREFAKCKPKHPNPQNILLECGEGTGSRTFTSSDDASFQIAHVTIDATCLTRPKVLIKFSSLVRSEIIGTGIVRLQYELFRVCGSSDPLSLGIWMFETNVNFTESLEESFGFVFCDASNFTDYCDYFVAVTPIEITGENTATVSHGQIAVLAQNLCGSLKNESKNLKNIILACGQGNAIAFLGTSIPPPVSIANISMDTTCLSKANVLIEYSSSIQIGTASQTVLQFELFRICGDKTPLSLGIWTFERTGSNVQRMTTFNFIYCDSNVPSSCCEYFVNVSLIQQSIAFLDEGVIIDNVKMTGIAQSSCGCFSYNEYGTLDKKNDSIVFNQKPKESLLECGSGTGMRTFTSLSEPTFQLAQVTIDTTNLCKPKVNIEFSSIITIDGGILFQTINQLRYELIRICNNREPISIGVWSIDIIDNFNDNQVINKLTNTFDFSYCDCITCPGCCDYIVTVTPIVIQQVTITVSDGRIAALAQEM
ncbi:DUF4489 domain-containing protein [Vallitalea pronyensis]|uniref:DUF4489 domain-containing protein n=1 Tax=Vallitalea pronyensis TaxID=1348613 RepID=A0A8J8MKY5_9FIRM|nr:DUF4489 domain-containing protein [Vallitalea pronyensis]QUI23421.1 DUF4489 domain-containing protein [Vallitalea pronyensis]